MEKKIIIFDLDDTLLNDEREVSEYTKNVLERAKKAGHILVINSARNQMRSQKIFDCVKPDYAIYNGGAQIVDFEGKNILEYGIPKAVCNEMIPDLYNFSEKFSMQNRDWFYSSNEDYKAPDVKFLDFASEGFPSDAYKIVAYSDTPDELASLAEKYDLDFVSYFGGPFCRFNKRGVTKSFGNRELIKLLGMSLDDAIVFGDDLGDLEMIDEAGMGVLMKNASDELKKGRTVSEYTNNEDGLAKFLENYLSI